AEVLEISETQANQHRNVGRCAGNVRARRGEIEIDLLAVIPVTVPPGEGISSPAHSQCDKAQEQQGAKPSHAACLQTMFKSTLLAASEGGVPLAAERRCGGGGGFVRTGCYTPNSKPA